MQVDWKVKGPKGEAQGSFSVYMVRSVSEVLIEQLEKHKDRAVVDSWETIELTIKRR